MSEDLQNFPYTDKDVLTPYARAIEFWDHNLDSKGRTFGFPERGLIDVYVGALANMHGLELIDSRKVIELALEEARELREQGRQAVV